MVAVWPTYLESKCTSRLQVSFYMIDYKTWVSLSVTPSI